MKEEIIKAYNENLTNYPTGEGMLNLRKSVSEFIKDRGGFDYKPEENFNRKRCRPLTYTIFKTIVDPGDVVIYPAPSWNNICYVQLSDAKGIAIELPVKIILFLPPPI